MPEPPRASWGGASQGPLHGVRGSSRGSLPPGGSHHLDRLERQRQEPWGLSLHLSLVGSTLHGPPVGPVPVTRRPLQTRRSVSLLHPGHAAQHTLVPKPSPSEAHLLPPPAWCDLIGLKFFPGAAGSQSLSSLGVARGLASALLTGSAAPCVHGPRALTVPSRQSPSRGSCAGCDSPAPGTRPARGQ